MRRQKLRLEWDRAHGVASLYLEEAARCVDAREVGDELVLHYDASGRCVEVQLLDPESVLAPDASAEAALRAAFEILAGQTPPRPAG